MSFFQFSPDLIMVSSRYRPDLDPIRNKIHLEDRILPFVASTEGHWELGLSPVSRSPFVVSGFRGSCLPLLLKIENVSTKIKKNEEKRRKKDQRNSPRGQLT